MVHRAEALRELRENGLGEPEDGVAAAAVGQLVHRE